MKHIIFYIFTFCIQLWIGQCAKFPGTDITSARILLNYCHKKEAFGLPDVGHARYHVKGLIEEYSRGAVGIKTAFENNEIQDEILQKMIGLENTKLAIEALNNAIPLYKGKKPFEVHSNFKKAEVSCSSYKLGYKNPINAPIVLRYENGKPVDKDEIKRMRGVTLVLAHKKGRQNNEDADVFIYTLYPN